MLSTLLFGVFVVVTAGLFALTEVQIEGGNGWAAALPTWRLNSRFATAVMGGRPLTGYHVFLQLFLLALVHLPYALRIAQPHAYSEVRILAYFILFWAIEDFLYFIVNPAFGLKNFRRSKIWWHSHAWWWIMPREYWLAIPLGIALYAYSRFIE